MIRAHLLDSADPLMQGQSYTSLCKVEVHNAFFVLFADGELEASSKMWSAMNGICRKCGQHGMQKRFRYAVVNHQEWIDYCARRNKGEELGAA